MRDNNSDALLGKYH